MNEEKKLPQVLQSWIEVFMHRSFRDHKRFMDQAGFSPSQAMTLSWLYRCGAVGISEIADNLGITNPAASQLVERLVQQGFLERTEDPNDRRFKQVTLAPKGRELIERSIEARRVWMEQLTEKFTAEEQNTLIEALTLLTDAAMKSELDQED